MKLNQRHKRVSEESLCDAELSKLVRESMIAGIDPILDRRESRIAEKVMKRLQDEMSTPRQE